MYIVFKICDISYFFLSPLCYYHQPVELQFMAHVKRMRLRCNVYNFSGPSWHMTRLHATATMHIITSRETLEKTCDTPSKVSFINLLITTTVAKKCSFTQTLILQYSVVGRLLTATRETKWRIGESYNVYLQYACWGPSIKFQELFLPVWELISNECSRTIRTYLSRGGLFIRDFDGPFSKVC